ncbi:MAG: hypothetical protein ACJA0Q_001886 [Saprospiraceae bacterium]|jgi:hypothetical protein
MKNLKSLTLIAVIALLSSCSLTMPYAATNNAIGSKRGTSETIMLGTAGAGILSSGIVFNKDYGVLEAIKKGGLTTVATVDIKVTDYLLFKKAEVIVTGE